MNWVLGIGVYCLLSFVLNATLDGCTGKNAFANQMKFKGQFFVGFLCAIGQVLRNMCVPVAPLYFVILISYVHCLVFPQVLTELTCFYLGQDPMLQLKCVL